MRGTSFIATISAIVPISASLLISAHASAVPALPSQWTLVNADQPLVQDGVLLFRFESGSGVAPELTPTVLDPHGSSIDGTVELLTIDSSASYGIFRPSSVLTEVGDYEIQGTDPFGFSVFSVAPGAIGPDAPPMEAIGMKTSQRMPTLQACCTTAEGLEVGACLALRSEQAPMILVHA